MRLLLDENLAPSLPALLLRSGIVADHTEIVNLNRTPDPVILRFAVAQGYDAVVTKDCYRKADARIEAP